MLTISLWTGDKSWAAAAFPTTSLIGRDRGGCALIGRPGAGGYDEIYRVIRRPWWGHFSKQSHSSIETELPPICNSLSGLASNGRGASLDRGHDLGPFWQLVTTIGPRTSPLSNHFLVSTIGNKVAFSCCSKKTFGKNGFSSETERLRDWENWETGFYRFFHSGCADREHLFGHQHQHGRTDRGKTGDVASRPTSIGSRSLQSKIQKDIRYRNIKFRWQTKVE